MFHSSHYAARATRSEFGDVSLNCDADFYPCLAKAPAPHHTRWVSRTSPQVTNRFEAGLAGGYRARATRRSDAAMAAAAAPGSGARVMGRPITSRSAPASSASSGVATRA